MPRLRRFAALTLVLAAGAAAPSVLHRAPAVVQAQTPPPSPIVRELNRFKQMGTVLYIAAHPDDENTQLIAYFSRARLMRSGYLSVTRGDGGQNLLGPELFDKLGVARTQELLAARRIDGGRQFFTRAIDFGYTKDYREALSTWGHDAVLSDVVRVVRTFRPDVVIAGFSTQPAPGQHGQHTASAVLAGEAFKMAGDPTAFPDQLATLAPWHPTRLLQNAGGFGARAGAAPPAGAIQIDIGGVDPATGEPLSRIALESRSMHKTQGFGNAAAGPGRGAGRVMQSLILLDGTPAQRDVFDGIDTTWARVPGGADVDHLTDEIIARFKPDAPGDSVPALLALRTRVAQLRADPLVNEKRGDLDHILALCLGLAIETTTASAEHVPGERLPLHQTVTTQAPVPVQWVALRYPASGQQVAVSLPVTSTAPASRDTIETLPASTPLSQPYWLREDGTLGLFHVDDPSLIGRPENPPMFPVDFVFQVGGQPLVVRDEPVQVTTTGATTVRRQLDAIPPVSIAFAADVRLFAPRATKPVTVDLLAARANTAGTLQLDMPAGWTVTPSSRAFHLATAGDHVALTFSVTAAPGTETARLGAHVLVGRHRYDTDRSEINYAHIPFQLLQRHARSRVVSLDLAIKGHTVGYLPGAGDSVPQSLREMGYEVRPLTGADLTPEGLRGLDSVVIGIRAFNTRTDLAPHLAGLFAYVNDGGTVVAQYNVATGLLTTTLAPLPMRITQDRVVDEHATMTWLAPDHPAMTTPNAIVERDFDGWVQERGLYYASEWDPGFVPLFAAADPGEAPLRGGLLVAKYGKGYYVYTSLAFFRQLPAGVPGAYRLFANLVSLGH